MSMWGVVCGAVVWQVVGTDWDKQSLPLGWVSFSPQEALTLIAEGGITHLLVEARSDLLDASLVTAADTAGISLVALITGAAGEEVARSKGVALRVRQPADLLDILQPPHTQPAVSSDAPVTAGLSIAVWGPTGAPGRTTVAASFASLIAGRGVRVVLVDADARSGAVAPALGLLDEVPGFVASCRLAHRNQLTPDDLRRLSHRYEQAGVSLDVLTGLTSGRHYPEVTPETITQVIEMAKNTWEVVIIDTGSDIASSHREPSVIERVAMTCLRVSDEAIALCQATPVGVARFSRVVEDATTLRASKPFPVVLNGVDPSRRSLADEATLREALRRFAGVVPAHVLPRDPVACRQAEMAGVSVADCVPGSPLVSALKAVAGGWVEDAMARRRRHEPAAAVNLPAPVTRRRKKTGGSTRWRVLSKRVFALR